MKNLEQDIATFLRDPNDFQKKTGNHSTLYLLRRDISLCFGYDPNNNCKIQFEALFPATMAVLAGVDLLAKFVYGDTNFNDAGKRFKDYIGEYITHDSKEELYQLRNCLLHSFGLYSEKKGKVYNFTLTRDSDSLIKNLSSKTYEINIQILWEKFNASIIHYHEKLLASPKLQSLFSKMYAKYGQIYVR